MSEDDARVYLEMAKAYCAAMITVLHDSKVLNIAGENFNSVDKLVFALASGVALRPEMELAVMMVSPKIISEYTASIVAILIGYLIDEGKLIVPTPSVD
jgi:hypothetical protein